MMEAFQCVTGAAIPLLADDINTDQIIPSAYLKQLDADLSKGLLAYMRRRPDGGSNTDFVLEKPQYQGAPILVTGRNFGCGSSREHAVWALTAFGIRCVIGSEPAEFFRENCLKNGVLPVELAEADMAAFLLHVTAVDGMQPFTVDLHTCEVRAPDSMAWRFFLAEHERAALLEGLDEIGMTLKHSEAIEAWEARTQKNWPFMQKSIAGLISTKR
jgi:3-isopropylmalate/(R)-2-methylmalate dehydratase small subunit